MINKNLEDKWICGAIPALFIHLCIGSVYCWSLMKDSIASYMGIGVREIEPAFTIAIFFLGMSAAFGGRLVEKNVKKSSLVSLVCFSLGLLGSAVSIYLGSVWGLFLTFGVIMGIGLGIGYLSPVKTLMLWFSKNKGLATGLAIMGFGLSKTIFSPYIVWCTGAFGIIMTLITMALISIIFMSIAVICIKKPLDWIEDTKTYITLKDSMKIILSPTYIKIWLMFFINITCGLVVISFEKNLTLDIGIAASMVGLVASVSAIFNALGRFGYATWSDYFKDKSMIYSIIFSSCFGMIGLYYIGSGWLSWLILLMIINLGYGGGFSTLPNLLQSIYGMNNISKIHGFALSAWAWAAVAALGITQILVYEMHCTYITLIIVLGILYGIGLLLSLSIKKQNL